MRFEGCAENSENFGMVIHDENFSAIVEHEPGPHQPG
jgi:hypothetical protein